MYNVLEHHKNDEIKTKSKFIATATEPHLFKSYTHIITYYVKYESCRYTCHRELATCISSLVIVNYIFFFKKKVKSPGQGQIVCYAWKGLVTRKTHVKYQISRSICTGSTVITIWRLTLKDDIDLNMPTSICASSCDILASQSSFFLSSLVIFLQMFDLWS